MKNVVKSKSTCYCGKPVLQDEKMICCVKCKRWLHAKCIKCLHKEILFGDRFYIVVCSVCNSGSECIARLEMTWSELIQLVLYHLSMLHRQKYFHIDEQIIPFFETNWNKLNIFGSVLTFKKEDRRSKILQVLEKNSKKFKSGKEIKKSKNIWALRVKMPPEAPPVLPLSAKLHNDMVLWEFQVKDRKYHILNEQVLKNSQNGTKNGKVKNKAPLGTQSRVKQNKVYKCRGSAPFNENGIHKVKKVKATLATPSFCEETAKVGLLEELIPYPHDFENSNHPFDSHSLQMQPKTAVKRRWNGEVVKPEVKVPPPQKDIFDAKDIIYFTQNPEAVKKYGLCIVGERRAGSGETQYLFQRNREITETVPVKKKSFQITILCTCRNCKQ